MRAIVATHLVEPDAIIDQNRKGFDIWDAEPDGRILQRTLEQVTRDPNGGVYRSFELDFEIRTENEKG